MAYDLIVVGGGPAGITAGIYAARQRLNALLITKSFGGQVARKAVAIENYPGFERISGMELMGKFKSHLKKFEIEIKEAGVRKIRKIKGKFIVQIEKKDNFVSKAVILASGRDPRPLEVAGEKKFIGRGVSYCSICDGPLFSNKIVAVIGGGNAGFEAAIALSNWAKKIYILEYAQKIGADETNWERVKKTSKTEVITSASLKKIQGKKFVESIVYQDRKSKKLNTLKVEGVFVEIGSQPATSFVKGLVDFNEKDEIKINPRNNQTKTPGLFAVGDATDVKEKQIIIAAGEGAKAALAAYDYLKKY